ncbi:hypothetical protein IAT40_005586 [Kwoniella sp. CBS 6097]
MMHNSGMPSMAYYSYSAQPSPATDSADQEFQFPTVSIPPRLKNIGRKISQMSNDFLPPGTPEDEEQKSLSLSPLGRKSEIAPAPVAEVPGMGDEPVMCPFCDKPLPPSLLAAQLTSGKGEHAHNNNNSRHSSQPPSSLRWTPSTRTGTPTPSAPLSRVTSATNPDATPASSSSRPPSSVLEPKALLDALPVTTPNASTSTSKSPEPATISPALPSATSESFAETVKEGDVANHTAAEKFITADELKRWSTLSGISLKSSAPTTSESKDASTPLTEQQKNVDEVKPAPETKKAFPLLPPPPPGGKLLKTSASQTSLRSDDKAPSASSSRFNFFRRDSQKDNGGEDDSDDDDDGAVAGGYAKLTAPGSPSDSEGEDGMNQRIENAKKKLEEEREEESENAAPAKKQDEEVTEPQIPTPSNPAVEKVGTGTEPPAIMSGKDDEIRNVLQEVLGRINEMSQSQTALLASHSTLLTSLKIARSNLAMAEANSEMLEAQLKRLPPAPPSASASTSRGPAGRNVSGPAATPGTPLSSLAPRASGDHVRATTTANATASPAVASTQRTPARASMEERPRPMSLHVTASDLINANSSSSAPSSAAGDSKSWGFWNGGKKKVAGALNQIHIPASTSAIGGGNPPSRPGTPSGERASLDSNRQHVPFFSEPSGAPVARTIVRPSPTAHSNLSRSLNTQPGGLSRSMSTTNVPSQRSASGPAPVSSQELATLRQAYSAAVAKMDGMSKELAELKKGKVEMEAELENLSQALFEEANKMVADERRKRAEMEENLKEVREEREVLKQTIKVLGGKVEDEGKEGGDGTAGDKGENDEGDEEKRKANIIEAEDESAFMPRDLDKHYEALSKAIHHVSSGADLASTQAATENDIANSNDGSTTTTAMPLVTEPLPLTPSLGGIVPIPELGHVMNIPSSSTRSSTMESSESDSGLNFGRRGGKGVSMSLPAEANPWATSTIIESGSPVETQSATPMINVKAATPSPQPHLPGLPEMDLESEFEQKKEGAVVEDKAGEGEAPSGLGLEIDRGAVVGDAEKKE